MAERTLAYFVSDVHLGLDVNDPAEREERFTRFLKSIPADRTEALYMLGDIWDFWFEYKDVVPRGHVRVFAALTELIDAGVKVYFFKGNHDMWTFGYLEELGIKVLEQPYLMEAGGKTFCLGHGDGLGPGMRPYKLMRSAFRSRFLQRAFSTLHPWLAFRIGRGWSRRSRLSKGASYEFRGLDEPLCSFALEQASKSHVDYFIFGHYHAGADLDLPCGSRLVVLKDWVWNQSLNWVLYDASTGRLGISQNIE